MNTGVTDKLSCERIPRFRDVIPGDGPGRLSSPAGDLVRFANGENTYQFAAYWDCLPGGPCRGNHYHLDKTEVMYVISGELRAAYYDLDTDQRVDTVLVAGDLVIVRPRLVHSYMALSPTQVVEVASTQYNPGDTHPYVLF
ncbi:dTDP-4-dehydrorhamnose 3,5-epimerase-like enzyme [Streptacidiphilus sp. MAP12-33]|uniref:cupin domain-containing protein n=1 Tax=Streptacidiphilus sp. MAP12-33 TaxID=3156266 RepID=UPI00351507A1